MPAAWQQNRLTEKLGIAYPIVQGPLGGLASQRLTAAVSNVGGLGSFGALSLEPDAIRGVIRQLRGLTDKPFAVNLWVSMEDAGARGSDEAAFAASLESVAHHFAELGISAPAYTPYKPVRFEDQLDVLIAERVPVFSFIYGVPSREILNECRINGVVTIGAATTVEEALALDEAGVDVIAASGFEAGGHRGSFLRPAEESLTGTISLVPQVVDAVRVPVIAAGGIADARGVVAALALGAEGVQMGSAFLACEESGATALHRQVIREKRAGNTGLTKGFTGRLARGVRNRLMATLNGADVEVLPYPLQRALMRPLTSGADAAGRSDLAQLWAGQSASLAACVDATTFLQNLVDDIDGVASHVTEWRSRRAH